MAQNPGQPASPRQAILLMRIIGISLGTGVTLFAFVSWFLHRQDGPMAPGVDAGLIFNLYLVLFLVAAVGAILVFRSRVAPILQRPAEETQWRARASAIQSGLIVSWALLDGAALAGEVVYLLTGHVLAGALGLALIWAGVLLAWPNPEWL